MIDSPRGLLVCLLTAALAACSSAPVTPVIDVGQTQRRAETEEANGNLARAAELYRTLANAVGGPVQGTYLLEAARLETSIGNYATAGELLTQAERAAPEQRGTAQIMRARLDVLQGMPAQGLARIEGLPVPSNGLPAEALEVRGLALFALDRPVDAIRSFVDRELWLDRIEDIRQNQRTVWDALLEAPLSSSALPTGDPVVDGWIALARIANVATEDERRRELVQWRAANNQHPAARVLLTELLLDTPGGFPSQIALLLPLSTPAREFALAVRDGFLAAHLGSEHDQAIVRIYDTGQEGATGAYLRAQLDGANFIVGPLLRPDVEAVTQQAGLVPTLALNYSLSETLRLANTYEFALAPEDEARAAARNALEQGFRRAVALVESSDRGYRIYNSFRNEFELGGGQVVSMMGYDDDASNYAARVTALMNIDRSNQRERRLAANLGSQLAFEPRRRQDVDVIFLAADADNGRLLAPQLEYYYAGDVPTYAISEIYDPLVTPDTRDLDRIVFPDVPWIIAPSAETARLRATIARNWPVRDRSVPRLYGLGYDAYKLVETLYGEPFFSSVLGVSGLLTMDLEGRIHRSLPFAQIRGGRPELIADLPRDAEERPSFLEAPLEQDDRFTAPVRDDPSFSTPR